MLGARRRGGRAALLGFRASASPTSPASLATGLLTGPLTGLPAAPRANAVLRAKRRRWVLLPGTARRRDALPPLPAREVTSLFSSDWVCAGAASGSVSRSSEPPKDCEGDGSCRKSWQCLDTVICGWRAVGGTPAKVGGSQRVRQRDVNLPMQHEWGLGVCHQGQGTVQRHLKKITRIESTSSKQIYRLCLVVLYY